MSALGLYCGARNVSSFNAFETWLGRDLDHALDFTAGDSWETIEDPDWWLAGWPKDKPQVTFSIPMLPRFGATLADGARGAYDSHWRVLAERFVAGGFPNAVLRVGWEFNGRWYPWYAGNGNEAAFTSYWRRIVTAMRAVSPNLRFEWCPTLGPGNMVNVEAAYPGDKYVNRIGTDVYDSGPEGTPEERWTKYRIQPYGLNWHANFAARHHKHMSHAEWGLWGVGSTPADVQRRGDQPYFIEQMYAWINANDVISACYFDVKASAEHRLIYFPKSQTRFKELFG